MEFSWKKSTLKHIGRLVLTRAPSSTMDGWVYTDNSKSPALVTSCHTLQLLIFSSFFIFYYTHHMSTYNYTVSGICHVAWFSWHVAIEDRSTSFSRALVSLEYNCSSVPHHPANQNSDRGRKLKEKKIHSKLRNITLCGNQSARDIKEFSSVNVDVWEKRISVAYDIMEQHKFNIVIMAIIIMIATCCVRACGLDFLVVNFNFRTCDIWEGITWLQGVTFEI